MNRLDRMIARLTAQRACLADAATLIADVPGPVLEIGFGKGRTYRFLREVLPAREIYAFDMDGAPDTDWGPDDAHFFAGDDVEDRVAGRGFPVALGQPHGQFDVLVQELGAEAHRFTDNDIARLLLFRRLARPRTAREQTKSNGQQCGSRHGSLPFRVSGREGSGRRPSDSERCP